MSRKTASFIIIVALLAAPLADAGQTYKWVDKDGKVHYSDQPVAGAEKIELAPINEVDSTPVPPPSESSDQPPPEPLDSATSYSAMTITQPKAGDTLRGAGIGLTIAVDLQPPLGGDDKIEYLLDGKVVPQSVPYVERGAHSVSARVVDPDGRIKISAPAVTIQVFQNTVPQQQTPPPKPKKP